MIDFFLTAHAWWQYVALVAVVVSLVFAFRSPMMDSTSETVYRLTAVAVDIQVALGIIVWLSNSGWSLGFVQGWLHPILGLAAAGALHGSVSAARKAHPEMANRNIRRGLIVVILLVVATIGIAEMA
jgi:heme A synthase